VSSPDFLEYLDITERQTLAVATFNDLRAHGMYLLTTRVNRYCAVLVVFVGNLGNAGITKGISSN